MPPPPDPILHRQLPVIEKIIRDETWLEGERRGGPVPSQDSVVRENVCQVVLRVGRELREAAMAAAAADTQVHPGTDPQIQAT
jgi:hypothetical protein